MAKVYASVEEDYVDTDFGNGLGLLVTCQKCGHTVEVLGVEEPSENAAFALLRESYPRAERNWYEAKVEIDDALLDRIKARYSIEE
ncbi:hypothetical protein N0B44_12510 [Roseibacterium beibuensis]|uniref:Uncharacterized protein n=1 Tax=[Roseibacterium] beibuensis TaxID=1193142 RepID=A0ABP9L650_9RHOB|nr:hypothetical protein [Roseibacterium beibuensis]MCS6623736.1 hypothetical protein [Roseibacterium beibuensis]